MEGEFHLSLRGNTQPSETLRVLDVTGCSSFSLSAGSRGAADDTAAAVVKDLQGVVDSTPALATVHLESVFLAGAKEDGCARGQCTTSACVGRERGKEKKRKRGTRVLECRRASSPSE
uniref:Uncharacterized protein n=1 Tax=Oryza glumipatula TaxID=40148 RepID=A0A0D9ZY65_9ORYZ